MNLMEHNYRDNRDNVLHYRDIGILIIAQPYVAYMGVNVSRYLKHNCLRLVQ